MESTKSKYETLKDGRNSQLYTFLKEAILQTAADRDGHKINNMDLHFIVKPLAEAFDKLGLTVVKNEL